VKKMQPSTTRWKCLEIENSFRRWEALNCRFWKRRLACLFWGGLKWKTEGETIHKGQVISSIKPRSWICRGQNMCATFIGNENCLPERGGPICPIVGRPLSSISSRIFASYWVLNMDVRRFNRPIGVLPKIWENTTGQAQRVVFHEKLNINHVICVERYVSDMFLSHGAEFCDWRWKIEDWRQEIENGEIM
jgi:hypothetical protein